MKNPWLIVIGPVLLAGLLYGSSIEHSFAWDDHYLVVNNPSLHSFEHLDEWFIHPWAAGSDSEGGRAQNALYWRPITQLSYAMDWSLGGGSPGVFHGTNVLLHMLCTGLLLFLVGTLWKPMGLPSHMKGRGMLLAGLLFAAHPVHTEAVHLITYRTTLLASAGSLGALLLFRYGKTTWALLPFILGLLSKEECIVTPGLIVLLDWLTRQLPAHWKDWVRKYGAFGGVALLYLVLHSSLTTGAALDFFAGQAGDTTFFTMMKVVALDLKLMFWPWPLTPFYDWTIFPYAHHPFHWEVLVGVCAIGLGAWLAVGNLIRRTTPSPTAGWFLFFLMALIPYSHLVPFFDVAGERFLYLPSIAFCAGLPMAMSAFYDRFPKPLWVGSGIILLIFINLTWMRGPAFKNTRSLLQATQEAFPHSFSAAYELGRAELKAKDFPSAELQFKAAFSSLPLEVAALCAATALIKQEKPGEAKAFLQEVSLDSRGVPRQGIVQVLGQWGGEEPPSSLSCDEGNMLETSP